MLLNGFCGRACLVRCTPRSRRMQASASFRAQKKKVDLFNSINYTSEISYTKEIDYEKSIVDTMNYESIFKDSEFQLLKLSDHGSLVPIEDKNTLPFSSELAYLQDEEELKHGRTKSDPVNALTKNPNETLLIKRIRQNGVKASAETIQKDWINFFQNIISNEKTIRNYNFELPEYPEYLELLSLKQYLQDINSISFDYDTKGRQQIVYNQLTDLLENLYKLDGMLDIDIMHEFIKFFGNFNDQLRIFKILKKFENLGILPNKDTLDLVIYKLNMIPHGQRKYWLELYLRLGTKEWNVVTDLRTRALVCILKNPSKERLATFKAIMNEGFPYEFLKWQYIEDILFLNVSQRRFDFDKIFKKMIKEGLASTFDKLQIFEIFVKQLALNKYSIISINQIILHQELETSDCWATVIETLILNNKIWEAYAVLNYAQDRRIDLQKIVVLFLRHRKRVYYAFYELQNSEKQKIFLEVEKYITSTCIKEINTCEKIISDFQNIRIDTKHMSNFIEKPINEMTERALLKDFEQKEDFELVMYKEELPWK